MKAGSGFKAKPKPLSYSQSLSPAQSFQDRKSPSPAEQRAAQKKALQKSTLRLLEKARQEAQAAGVDLSEWESEFLDGVAERVKTYGRAFADPDKGAMTGTLSLRQGVKLREIRKKAQSRKTDTDDGAD